MGIFEGDFRDKKMWQEILTVVVVALAVLFLVKRYLLPNQKKTGCSNCGPGDVKQAEKNIKKPAG